MLAVKNLLANARDLGSIPRLEDLLEKEMASHSSILAWKIPWMEEPSSRLQSMGSQKVGHNWMTSLHYSFAGASLVALMVKNLPTMWETWLDSWVKKIPWGKKWLPPPIFLPGESAWTEEPYELWSIGSQRVWHDWATKHKRKSLKTCIREQPIRLQK